MCLRGHSRVLLSIFKAKRSKKANNNTFLIADFYHRIAHGQFRNEFVVGSYGSHSESSFTSVKTSDSVVIQNGEVQIIISRSLLYGRLITKKALMPPPSDIALNYLPTLPQRMDWRIGCAG